MTPANPDRRTFLTLDGMRGVAALAVAFRHIPANAVAALTPKSYLAVDLFFVISGFVLAYAYEGRLRAGMGLADFVVARIIRLYPLYLAASLITLLLVAVPATTGHYHPPERSTGTIVRALLFVPTIDPARPQLGLFPLVGPAWSLCFELVANLVFAIGVLRLGPKRLAAVVAIGAALLIATVAHFGSIEVGFRQTDAWGGFGRVGFAFFAGVAAYRLWRAEALPWLRVPASAAIALVVLIFHGVPTPYPAAADLAVVIVVMPALVLAAARGEPRRLAPTFARLGVASYAIYLLQNPVDQWYETLVPYRLVPGYAGVGTGGAVALVALTVVLASALDRYYDVPVRRALTRAWRSVRGDYHSAPLVIR